MTRMTLTRMRTRLNDSYLSIPHHFVLSVFLMLSLAACGGTSGDPANSPAPASISGNNNADTAPPSVNITSPATTASTNATITLSGTATDNVGVTKLSWSNDRGGSGNLALNNNAWTTSVTLQSGANVLTVSAQDAASNIATAKLTVTFTVTSDTLAPSVPTNLSASAVSFTQINLSWTASSDNVGVAGYKVFRNGTQIATTGGTTYPDTGLSASTTYTYTVSAYDAAGNNSAKSASANAATPTQGATTVLGALAAQMQPGTWAVLNTQGLATALVDPGNGSFITQYTDRAKWDPISKQVLFIGAAYGFSSGAQRGNFIKYNDAANQWAILPRPVGPLPNLAHAYNHTALNPATGEFYHSLYNDRDIYRYDPITASWSLLTTIPQNIMGGLQITKGLEYFPEMGGLVWYSSGIGLYFFNTSTKQWSVLVDSLGTSTYHELAAYDPVHKIVIFGGGEGSNAVYKLDATGKVTQMKGAPIGLGITQSVITVDPVSGKFLVVGEGQGFYEYDVVADKWTQLSVSMPSGFFTRVIDNNPIHGTIATPISTYGVVLFAKYDYDQSKVWIYKHSAP